VRISLKQFLILISVLVLGIGFYISHREAELGVQIRVPKPIELDEFLDAPAFVTEIRSRRQVREHDHREEAEAILKQKQKNASLLASLSVFSKQVHLEFMQEHRDEFIKLAQQQIDDPDLGTAANAAWVLDFYNDKLAYQKIRDRYIDDYADETLTSYRPLYDFMEVFERDRLVKDPVFVDFLRTLTTKENELDWLSSAVLHYQEVDSEPHYQYMLKKARNGRDKSHAFVWLVKEFYNAEVRQALMEFLDAGNNPRHFRIISFIKIERPEPDWIPIRNRIEHLAYEFLRDPNPTLWKREQRSFWKEFCEAATETSAEFLRNAFENTQGQDKHLRSERILYSCQALERLGHRKDAEVLLKAAFEADKKNDPYAFADTKRQMFDLAEKLWGRDETIKLCFEHIADSHDEAACNKLADIFEGTRNEEIAKRIAVSDRGSHRLDMISQVEQVGSELLPSLWESSSTRQATFAVFQQWKERNVNRQDFVDWINSTLTPKSPLTIQSVLNHPNYKDGNNLWEIQSPVIRTDHQFAMVALAHSGKGKLFNDSHEFERDGLDKVMESFANLESPEFKITSTHLDWSDDDWYKFSIVVNNKLYKFTIRAGHHIVEDETTGEAYYENHYATEAVMEIMNAIAIRQHLKGRFLWYQGEGLGDEMNLVLYLTHQQAQDLQAKFAIKPRIEFEYYLQH
jgi:hypothetical protein